MKVKKNVKIFLYFSLTIIFFLVFIFGNRNGWFVFFLFYVIGFFVPFMCHALTKKEKKSVLLSLVFSPIAISFACFLSCIGNSDAMMWLPIGLFFVLIYTSPSWIVSSFFAGKLAKKFFTKRKINSLRFKNYK